jgi:hypothetical protein
MMMNFKNTREGTSTHSEVLRTKMDGHLSFGLVQRKRTYYSLSSYSLVKIVSWVSTS